MTPLPERPDTSPRSGSTPDPRPNGSSTALCAHPRGRSHPRAYGFEVVMWCPDCRQTYVKGAA